MNLSARYSVVIPSYNRPVLLQRALSSLYEQTLMASRILLVIDEAENLSKYHFLDNYDARLCVRFTGGGFGGAKARNLGLDLVEEEYVFFLDDDDAWLPEKAEKQINLLQSRSDCIGVTCWSNLIERGRERVREVGKDGVVENIRIVNATGSFSYFGFRMTMETKELRLDENLRAAQDFEFYMRLSEYGKIGVVNKVLADYYIHSGERISANIKEKAISYRYILDRHGENWNLVEKLFTIGKIQILECAYRNLCLVVFRYPWTVMLFLVASRDFNFSKAWMKRGLKYIFQRIFFREKRGLN